MGLPKEKRIEYYKQRFENAGTSYSRKYREVPHPKLHFVSYCEQFGSAYVDSDIFILKGA